jgi:hypothetical protein
MRYNPETAAAHPRAGDAIQVERGMCGVLARLRPERSERRESAGARRARTRGARPAGGARGIAAAVRRRLLHPGGNLSRETLRGQVEVERGRTTPSLKS